MTSETKTEVWRIAGYNPGMVVTGEDNDPIAECLSGEDAAFIAKAVNNHDALVAMVREFADHVRDEDDPLDIKYEARKLLASLD